jgi:hypothetical protein
MKWKHRLRYPFDIRLAKRLLSSHGGSRFDSVALPIGFDLYTDQLLVDCGRHLTCLAALAKQIHSQVVLRCSPIMLAAIAHKVHGAEFLAMRHVRWIGPKRRFPEPSLVMLDVDRSEADRDLDGHRSVTMLIGRDVCPGTPVMPYPMHPNQIEALTDASIASFRRTPKAGLFFAGNQKQRYGRETMQNEFGVLPRLEILAELRRHFPGRIAPQAADGSEDRIVLRNSATDPIAGRDWMSVLAAHRFFLCCPGASQPVCHNVIEAMSVGAIPVIEYSDRFTPALVDGQNAICFKGREGLIRAVRRIDAMSAESKARMSENVCRHFDEHLSGVKFVRQLRDDQGASRADQISMPFHNRNLFTADSPQDGRLKRETRAA